jgi:hypothetical protein
LTSVLREDIKGGVVSATKILLHSLHFIEEDYMKKAYVLGVVTGLALLIVAGVAGFQLQKKDVEDEGYRAELVDASPVQSGAFTERQRVHSKQFAYYQHGRNFETINETVAKAKGQTKIVELEALLGLGEVRNEPQSPETFFGELARLSNAVIRGRVIRKHSYVTEDGTFIYTDYDVSVAEVFKDNPAAPISTGATITVTHPGGKVVLDKVIVKANDEAFGSLLINDNDVMLFLRFIPETGTYKATRPNGTFELSESSLRPLTKRNFPPGVLRDRESFLQAVRAASKE